MLKRAIPREPAAGLMKMTVTVFSVQDAADVMAGKLEAYPTWRKLPACDSL